MKSDRGYYNFIIYKILNPRKIANEGVLIAGATRTPGTWFLGVTWVRPTHAHMRSFIEIDWTVFECIAHNQPSNQPNFRKY